MVSKLRYCKIELTFERWSLILCLFCIELERYIVNYLLVHDAHHDVAENPELEEVAELDP